MTVYVHHNELSDSPKRICDCKATVALDKPPKTAYLCETHKLSKLTDFKWFCVPFSFLLIHRSSLWLLYGLLIKQFYISMSSSPELWATEKLYEEACVSAGGLGGLWGEGDGHGVRGCWETVCCLSSFCKELFCFRQNGSSGGRHNTNSMQEWLLKNNKCVFDF